MSCSKRSPLAAFHPQIEHWSIYYSVCLPCHYCVLEQQVSLNWLHQNHISSLPLQIWLSAQKLFQLDAPMRWAKCGDQIVHGILNLTCHIKITLFQISFQKWSFCHYSRCLTIVWHSLNFNLSLGSRWFNHVFRNSDLKCCWGLHKQHVQHITYDATYITFWLKRCHLYHAAIASLRSLWREDILLN